MYDPTTHFQDELARRLLRRAAKLHEQADRLADASSVFRRSPLQGAPHK
ncbi:MAG TPA: hypothetical protein VE820_13950 [Sphingomicrobium sp.]|nr:hypothetical protein [Sphingomicrobium sp.]